MESEKTLLKTNWKLNKEKLYRLRIEKNWTQEDAADACEIYNVRQYVRLENGETEQPRKSTLNLLIKGFGLSDTNEIVLSKNQKPLKSDYEFYLNNKYFQSNIFNYKLNPDIEADKLIALGLDNTILKGYNFAWKLVWDYLTIDDKIRRDKIRDYHQNKISYNKWVDEKAKLFIENNLNRKDFEFILKDVDVVEGFEDFINHCKKQNYAIALISGGIDTLIKYKIPNYKYIFDYVTVNKFIYNERGQLVEIIPTPYDFKDKIIGITHIQNDLNISPKNTIFIGGGYNNIHTLQAAKTCISFDSNSIQLNEGFNINVSKPDLREVIPHLD